MKVLFVLSLLTFSYIAKAEFNLTVISERVFVLPVDISQTRLKFTNLGYGSFLVKVIIPELAGATLLNHRNEGEDGPCLFTIETGEVDDVLQNRPEIIDTEFTIKLIKATQAVGDQCHVTLTEQVTANIRGFHFQHTEIHQMPARVLEDCQ